MSKNVIVLATYLISVILDFDLLRVFNVNFSIAIEQFLYVPMKCVESVFFKEPKFLFLQDKTTVVISYPTTSETGNEAVKKSFAKFQVIVGLWKLNARFNSWN